MSGNPACGGPSPEVNAEPIQSGLSALAKGDHARPPYAAKRARRCLERVGPSGPNILTQPASRSPWTVVPIESATKLVSVAMAFGGQ